MAIRVDADARPDLAERFAAYHWPATVFLSPDASEIAARRGYVGPDEFASLLDRVLDAARRGVVLGEIEKSHATKAVGAASTAFLECEAVSLAASRLADALRAFSVSL